MSEKDEPRIIGIRHRTKRSAEGEERPTLVAIREPNGETRTLQLKTETDELDFLLGRFPIKHRATTKEDRVEDFRPHQCRFARLRKGGDPTRLPEQHIHIVGRAVFVLTHVPCEFDGLQSGDRVVMLFGGSGDRFAYALSNRGNEIGASVHRVPAFRFQDFRPKRDKKDDDHVLLTQVFTSHPELFQKAEARDRAIIRVRLAVEARADAMKARMACGQRLRQRFIGRVFLNPEGHYPEGNLEDVYAEAEANDTTFQTLLDEEKKCAQELERAVQELDIWKRFFRDLEGVGPVIAGEIVASISDIRRFETKAKLKRYLGVHVCLGGEYGDENSTNRQFPRRRGGQVANWSGEGRQALYKFADQWNRRPNSEWGKKLREYKVKFRERHPEVMEENGKKRYTDGHIHKMAIWRTITKFTEALFRAWWQLERETAGETKPAHPVTTLRRPHPGRRTAETTEETRMTV